MKKRKTLKRKTYPHKCVHVWTNHWVLTSPLIGVKCITKEEAVATVRRNSPYENLYFSRDKKTLHRFFSKWAILDYIDWLINTRLWHSIDWRALIHNMRDKDSEYRADALCITQHLLSKHTTLIGSHYWLTELDRVWRTLS